MQGNDAKTHEQSSVQGVVNLSQTPASEIDFSDAKRRFDYAVYCLKDEDSYSALAALRMVPVNADRSWRLLLADLLIQVGNVERAMGIYETLHSLDRTDEQACAGRIHCAFWLRYLDEAVRLLEAARKLFPNAPWLDAMDWLVVRYQKPPEIPLKKEWALKTGANMTASEPIAEKSTESSDQYANLSLHERLSIIDDLYWSGKTDEALSVCRLALLDFPLSFLLFWRLFFWAPTDFPLTALTKAFAETNRWGFILQARNLVSFQWLLNPRDPLGILGVVRFFLLFHDFESATDVLESALKRFGENRIFRDLLLKSLFLNRRFDEALTMADQKIEEDPTYAPYHLPYLLYGFVQGDLDKMMKHWNEMDQKYQTFLQSGRKLHPKKVEMCRFLTEVLEKGEPKENGSLASWIDYGDALLYADRPEEALAVYQKILDRPPHPIIVHRRIQSVKRGNHHFPIMLARKFDKKKRLSLDEEMLSKLKKTYDDLYSNEGNSELHSVIVSSVRYSGMAYIGGTIKRLTELVGPKQAFLCASAGRWPIEVPIVDEIPNGLFFAPHINYFTTDYVFDLDFIRLCRYKNLKRYWIVRHPIDVALSPCYYALKQKTKQPDLTWEEAFALHFSEIERCFFGANLPIVHDPLYYQDNSYFKMLRFEDVHADPLKFFTDFLIDVKADHLVPYLPKIVEAPRKPPFFYKQFLHIPKFRAFLENLPTSYMTYIERLGYTLEL